MQPQQQPVDPGAESRGKEKETAAPLQIFFEARALQPQFPELQRVALRGQLIRTVARLGRGAGRKRAVGPVKQRVDPVVRLPAAIAEIAQRFAAVDSDLIHCTGQKNQPAHRKMALTLRMMAAATSGLFIEYTCTAGTPLANKSTICCVA